MPYISEIDALMSDEKALEICVNISPIYDKVALAIREREQTIAVSILRNSYSYLGLKEIVQNYQSSKNC